MIGNALCDKIMSVLNFGCKHSSDHIKLAKHQVKPVIQENENKWTMKFHCCWATKRNDTENFYRVGLKSFGLLWPVEGHNFLFYLLTVPEESAHASLITFNYSDIILWHNSWTTERRSCKSSLKKQQEPILDNSWKGQRPRRTCSYSHWRKTKINQDQAYYVGQGSNIVGLPLHLEK